MKYFGNTWWGEQWLNSLTHLDYENRLPRGSRYARNGSVRNLAIDGNVITAKVSGSRPRPYKVRIEVPLFAKEKSQALVKAVAEQPVLVSKLLNRELDASIMTIADQIGIKVFPSSWHDFDMSCDCPDWAVPCKHLAAVILLVSREIDNNPFLVFSLHGLDLLAEMQNCSLEIPTAAITTIPNLVKQFHEAIKEPSSQVADNAMPDLSHLNDLHEALAQLLPHNPSFFHEGDFWKSFTASLKSVATQANRILGGNIRRFSAMETIHLHSYDTLMLQLLPERFSFEATLCNNDKNIISASELLISLLQIPFDSLWDYPKEIVALHQTCYCALHLLSKGAVIPELCTLTDMSSNARYIIRWTPATNDSSVSLLMKDMQRCFPSFPVWVKSQAYQPAKPHRGRPRKTPVDENPTPVPKEVSLDADWMVSLMLQKLIPMLSTQQSDLIGSLFFQGFSSAFDGVGDRETPGAIQTWVGYLTSRALHHPLRVVMELKTNATELFELHLFADLDGIPVEMNDILTKKKYLGIRMEVLQDVAHLFPLIEGLEQYVNNMAREHLVLSMQQMSEMLIKTIPSLRLMGVNVLLPKELSRLVRPQVVARIQTNASASKDGKSYLRIDQLLDFDWELALGGQKVSPQEFFKLVKNAQGLFFYKGQYIYVGQDDIERLMKSLSQDSLPASRLLQMALQPDDREGGETQVVLTPEVQQLITQLREAPEVARPRALKATLRPYQVRGYDWLYRNLQLGFGSILADDMGLGKTIQVIALLLKLKQERQFVKSHALVVAPSGLLLNWQQELSRFAPTLTVCIYHGAGRSLDKFDANVMLTSYGVLRSDHTQLNKVSWSLMVIDEAQNIKNDNTAQSKAVRSMKAQARIALSGTPVENRLSEFWSIMDFVNPGYLGTAQHFGQEFAHPIQQNGDESVAHRFRAITAPFMMRRLKSDKNIITDLPDKVEQDVSVGLSKQQAALYQQTMQEAMKTIESVVGDDSKTLFKRSALVLQMILSLKQICDHPALFLKNDQLDTALSGKMQVLIDLLQSIIDSRQKVLLFTQFKEMGDILQQVLQEHFARPILFLHGGCTIKQRQQMVDRFQNNPAENIFILSLKAAGTGLNLTAASHVIHYDLWWNPAVEAQATDRAYRIGQHQNVMVHRFITQNTFEERINAMIQDKKKLADITVATGESWITKMSNSELRTLFSNS